MINATLTIFFDTENLPNSAKEAVNYIIYKSVFVASAIAEVVYIAFDIHI